MTADALVSIPDVCDVRLLRGSAARNDAAPDLLVEVPHGATRALHFTTLRSALRGTFPEGLQDFFFVNTDVGAPEVGLRVAERAVAAEPRRSAVFVRCLIPRTFIDCNRVIDAASGGTTSQPGAMTPGVVSYVREPEDLRVLFERYSAYRKLVAKAFERVCGAGGTGLMVHSYAPRSIDVPVDEKIVERLRAAYQPDVLPKWPLRAEVDLITHAPNGMLLADEALAARVRDGFVREGLAVARNGAYSLHPSSMGWVYASRYPARTLCLEMRRDLLVREFTPFAEMEIDPEKADLMAGVLAGALVGPA